MSYINLSVKKIHGNSQRERICMFALRQNTTQLEIILEYKIHLLPPKYFPSVIRWTKSTLYSIVVVQLSDKHKTPVRLRMKGDYSFVIPARCSLVL